MCRTNRDYLVGLSQYDTLMYMNDRLLVNGGCVIKAFSNCPDSIDQRCEKFNFLCQDCVQSWLNEPFGYWNHRVKGVAKTHTGNYEQGQRFVALEDILVFAMRYSIGRRTYAPSTVCGFITPLLPILSDRVISVMRRDILEHGGFNRDRGEVDEYGLLIEAFGDECDYETWRRFYELVDAEAKRRNIIT